MALRTTCTKMSNSRYQNKDRLSVCRILLLQRKPKLGSTKSSHGPYAARGPRVGHSWFRANAFQHVTKNLF